MVGISQIGPAATAAFLGSLVEAVEALTIVLAAATVRGWRAAGIGAAVGLVALGAIVATLGPLLSLVPLAPMQFAVGVLLLLFGTRWLRKAILRAAGIVSLRDEDQNFATQLKELRGRAVHHATRLDWIAGITAGKAVLVEGLEVVFIVLAVSAAGGLIVPAAAGAVAACLLVIGAGLALRRPLARVPENALKFGVGVMLSAFGVFWVGEGLGLPWPGADLAIVAFAALFLGLGLALVAIARRHPAEETSS